MPDDSGTQVDSHQRPAAARGTLRIDQVLSYGMRGKLSEERDRIGEAVREHFQLEGRHIVPGSALGGHGHLTDWAMTTDGASWRRAAAFHV